MCFLTLKYEPLFISEQRSVLCKFLNIMHRSHFANVKKTRFSVFKKLLAHVIHSKISVCL